MTKDVPKDEWTLNPKVRAGDRLLLAWHRVEVIKILRTEPEYCVARVKVLGPVPGAAGRDPITRQDYPIPPLKWCGELYDTEGQFVEQPRHA